MAGLAASGRVKPASRERVKTSHHNARALAPHQRQLPDDLFQGLVARGGVASVCLDAWMLVPGWERGRSTPAAAGVRLERVADHIDHFCQLAGDARHVGIGSDLDGAFGTEQTPADVDSITDLRALPGILRARGYRDADVAGILGGNLIDFLRRALP
ncbi:MAG: membrane dipeptidase [Verrucomicrobiota bacterium]